DYTKIQIFPDISAATLRKRKEFLHITTALRNNGIRYRWGYPTKLLVVKDGVLKPIFTPEDGAAKLKAWGINPQLEPAQAPPRHRLRLEWQAAP
ncbi:Hypothetical predicted protein, partial [Pelobates cultripes]